MLVLLFSFFASAARAQSVEVLDGDTLRIDGTRVRIFGIDAPENGQYCTVAGHTYDCSSEAKRALARILQGKKVVCTARDRDRYRRVVAVCYASGVDIGRQMVREGWALAFRRYSIDYVSDEGEAQKAKRGMWAGSFTPPWDYRRR